MKARRLLCEPVLFFPGVERLEQQLIEFEVGDRRALPEALAKCGRHFEGKPFRFSVLTISSMRPPLGSCAAMPLEPEADIDEFVGLAT